MLLGIIAGHDVLEVGAGRQQLATQEQTHAEGIVAPYLTCRIVLWLGHGEQLLGQRLGLAYLPSRKIPPPEALQDRQELWTVPDLLAQRVRPGCRRLPPRGWQSPGSS